MTKGKDIVHKKKTLPMTQQVLKKAIAAYKRRGFYDPSFETITNIRQLKWLYYYFNNGFKGPAAYEAAGYRITKNVHACVGQLKIKLARQISCLIENMDVLDNDLDIDLLNISNTTLAEFEPFMSGEKTLTELAEEGVNISAITDVIQGQDRDGNPYAKVTIESAAKIKMQLKKMKQKADMDIQNQFNIAEQTIYIHTNVPTYDERSKKAAKAKEEDIIDVEADDVSGDKE